MALLKRSALPPPALLLAVVLPAIVTGAFEMGGMGGSSATTTTSEANEFYLGFLRNYVKPALSLLTLNETSLYITTREPNGTTVTITYAGTQTIVSLTPEDAANPTAVRRWEPPVGVRVQGSWDRYKGVKVKADRDKKISIYTLNEEIHSVEGYTALPCVSYPAVYQYVYFAVSVPRSTAESASQAESVFLIVACRNNTSLEITTTQDVSDPRDANRMISAGRTFSFQLDELETLYIHSPFDLTGSKVTSNNPVTFISGHECGNVPYNVLECDHLVEQIPPTTTWGRQFLTVPTAGQTVGDFFKIVAAEDDTDIQITCQTSDSLFDRSFSLEITTAGESKNFSAEFFEYCSVMSEKRMLLVKFIPGFHFSNGYDGDPFMVQIPAVSQYINHVTVALANGFGLYFENYLSLMVPEEHFDENLIKLDGVVLQTDWVAIPCSQNTSCVCGYGTQYSSERSKTHHIVNEKPGGTVGVTVYGTSYLETYAFTGGLSLTPDVPASMLVVPQQTSFIVLSSDPLCLRCELTNSGSAPPIEWSFDSSPSLPANTQLGVLDTGSLCISRSTQANTGNYTCTSGTNTLTFTVSVIAGIIIQPPTCRPPPSSNDTILLGIGNGDTSYIDISTSAVEICCSTHGNVESVQWLVGGVGVNMADPSYEIGDGYLKVSGPFQEVCVVYTCSVMFDGVDSTVSATAEVCAGEIGPPTAVSITGEVEIIEGGSVSLTCSSDGYPAPMKIWSLGGGALPSNAVAGSTGSLLVERVREGDGTLYCCDVGNTHGTASSCKVIKILILPEIRQPVILSAVFTRPVSLLPPSDVSAPPSDLLEPGRRRRGEADIGQTVMVLEGFDLRVDCVITRGKPTPVVSWFKNGVVLSNSTSSSSSSSSSSRYELLQNGSLLIVGVVTRREDGVYICRAESDIGHDELNSTITVIVAPVISEPGPPFTSLGNCHDTTAETTSSQQVGSGQCLRAGEGGGGGGEGTRFTLTCRIEKGFPPPHVTWLKDGAVVNTSSMAGLSLQPEDSSLLIENISLPLEALAGGVADLSGLYTCSAENIAGVVTASSYVFPFGNISRAAVSSYFRPRQLQLFHQLFSDVAEHVEALASEEQHLALLGTARLLGYDDYYPGRDFDGSEETIPPVILENMFSLVDVIPDASSLVADIEEEPLAEVYKSLVHGLQVKGDDTDPVQMQEAREYLQAVVDDTGGLSDIPLPRLSLYLQYKSRYYLKKLEVETLIEAQRKRLFGRQFSDWYDRQAQLLQSGIDDAMTKWNVFGDKDAVEKNISKLNLEDFSEPLDEARSLLLATRKRSKTREDAFYYPVEFVPSQWFELLQNCVSESIEQMQYHIAKLEAQKKTLEITRSFLQEEVSCGQSDLFLPSPSVCPRDQFTNDPASVFNQLDGVKYFMEHEVEISERSRYKCLVTRNPTDCELYRVEYDVVKGLMDVYADLYLQAEFVRTATNHREVSIPTLSSAIHSINSELEIIGYIMQVEVIGSSSRVQSEEMFKKIPIANRIDNFKFSTMDRPKEHAFELPSEVEDRLLWYFNEKSTRFIDKETVDEYNETFNHLNTLHTNVSAKLVRVDINRRWFRPSVLANSHLTLTDENGDAVLVSPGVIKPSEEGFQSAVRNSSYSLPVFPTSLLLATDIRLSINTPFPFHTLPRLLKISYDRHLQGGFGPFTFGQLFKSRVKAFKFRIEVHGNGITLTLPGTQLIGYLCGIVPRSPTGAHDESLLRRRKRSTFADGSEHFVKFAEFHSPLTNFDRWLLKNDLLGDMNKGNEGVNGGRERHGEEDKMATTHSADTASSTGTIVPTSTPLMTVTNTSTARVAKG